jgi:hypothetical protein
LAKHVEPIPFWAVGHFVPLCVTECFRQSTTGTNPTAICTLTPKPNYRGDDDEGLDKANDQPPPQGLVCENVPNEERPSEDESEGPPIFTPSSVDQGKEIVGERLSESGVKEPVVTHPGKQDVG